MFSPVSDLTHRADPRTLPEYIDEPSSREELKRTLLDIARLNRVTVAPRPILVWLQQLLDQDLLPRPFHLVDVGCGYGDTLRRIQRWLRGRNLEARLTGVDLNPDCIQLAVQATPPADRIDFIASDLFAYHPFQPPDLIVSSLFAHHLPDEKLVEFLLWMERTARRGWMISDLHRKPMPYRIFPFFARLTGCGPASCHDGLVSIRRSFLAEDWQRLAASANLPDGAISITEHRPARLCVSRIRKPHAEAL